MRCWPRCAVVTKAREWPAKAMSRGSSPTSSVCAARHRHVYDADAVGEVVHDPHLAGGPSRDRDGLEPDRTEPESVSPAALTSKILETRVV